MQGQQKSPIVMEQYQAIVSEQLDEARHAIERVLTPAEDLSARQAGDIIGTYRVAIEPNFIPWMVQAYQTARSNTAKSAILDNLMDEVHQDHPRMLRDFCAGAGVSLSIEHYRRASQPVIDMWSLFSKGDGLINTTVAATLENTSRIFIPYLAKLATDLRSSDLSYTDAHGEADLAHAEELYGGLVNEMRWGITPWRTVATSVEKTTSFLQTILSR